MATFAVSITKEILWRDGWKPVSNVYHYNTDVIDPFPDDDVINKLVEEEKLIFATNVNFVKARTWGPTGMGSGPSKMRAVKNLTGSGAATPSTNFYPEFAQMVYWPLGRYGVRNHPQYLRKWLHLNRSGPFNLAGGRYTGVIPPDMQRYIDNVTNLVVVSSTTALELCTEDGEHQPTGPGALYPYLEHRQIGR